MQIISGERKGKKLYGPGPEEIRPIRHLVRKALFDILRQVISGSLFLDLYAGTGSVGLEALSRGANHVTFVDQLPDATRLINKNLDALTYTNRATVYQMDTEEALEKFDHRDRRFDIVFLGPPYQEGLSKATLKQLGRNKVVKQGGLVGVEVFFKNDLADGYDKLVKIKEREYGQNKLAIYRKKIRKQG